MLFCLEVVRFVLIGRRDTSIYLLGSAQVHPCNARSPAVLPAALGPAARTVERCRKAALDVHRGRIYGRVEHTTGISPFNRLVTQVMTKEPYASADRVFWIVDQGSSHRPSTFPQRLREMFPNAIAVTLPVHASWLNQIEIYFSILQRKLLTPNDFQDLEEVRRRLHQFARSFSSKEEPFAWNFTRRKLRAWLKERGMPSVPKNQAA